jgi:hypothetical protein
MVTHPLREVCHETVSTAAVVLAAVSIPSLAGAGIVEITGMKKGSQAAVNTYDQNNKLLSSTTINDTNNDGKVAVEVPQQDKTRRIVTIKLDVNSKRVVENGRLKTTTMLPLEPFQLPSFLPIDPALALQATFDVNAFLAQPVAFTPGQIIPVSNGVIAQTPFITFQDPSGLTLPPVEPFDVTMLDTLPGYTGNVLVGSPTLFAPIPEPSTFALLGAGLLGLMLAVRWRDGIVNALADESRGERDQCGNPSGVDAS